MNTKWIDRFIGLAAVVSTWSRDPSTKVGAVIVRPNKSIASVGFNGFPIGVKDNEADYLNREIKYQKILHAEINAFSFLNEDCRGYSLFTYPFGPCSRCACQIIQKGITNIYFPAPSEELRQRWGKDLEIAQQMFSEAGVKIFEIPLDKSKF